MFRLYAKLPFLTACGVAVRCQASSSNAEGAAAAGARRRLFPPAHLLPKFEIHDVRDEAAQGSMTRVAVDGKQLLVSQFPQLGPRKADPNDVAPQFDVERRISVRFRHTDLGAMVAVVEGRLPSHHMKNNAYDLNFEKTATGYALKGQVTRGTTQVQEAWAIQFENQFAVTLEHFLDSALTESFGFRKHQTAVQRRLEQERNNNNNNNNNSNNNNNNNNGRNKRNNSDNYNNNNNVNRNRNNNNHFGNNNNNNYNNNRNYNNNNNNNNNNNRRRQYNNNNNNNSNNDNYDDNNNNNNNYNNNNNRRQGQQQQQDQFQQDW